MRHPLVKMAALLLVLLLAAVGSAADPATLQMLTGGSLNDFLAVLLKNNDPEAYNLLSRAYYAMEDWDSAIRYGERAVSARPDNATYHWWLGRQYGEKAAVSNPLLAANLARKTKNEFERSVKLDPTNVAVRADLSEYYIEAPFIMGGGIDKARDQAAQVQKYDAATGHWILARAAEQEKHYDEAEREYRAAIASATSPAPHWMNLAAFYRGRGRLDDMERAIASALAVPGNPAATYYDAAGELSSAGRNYPAAAQYLKKYLASGSFVEDAPAFRAHYRLGQIYEKMNNKPGAIAEYQSCLALASGFDRARQALDQLQ